ncbi:kinase-like domain-containing protein [Baffinella frigidus]|nr:kinase-like domain-containing protein [Cryptophyta sp. CCMP2293]
MLGLRLRQAQVALKVQKSATHYTEAAMDEIEFLHKASQTPGRGADKVVRLLDSFRHTGPNGTHVCMVFEPMGPNLLALIKDYNYRGIPMDIVREITRQVLMGLDFLHIKCSIIHTDLKAILGQS